MSSRPDRRELATAVLGALLGSAIVLLAAGQAWVRGTAVQEPLRVDLAVTGGSLVPAVPALALVCLAGAVGVLAARTGLRRLVGVAIAAAGLGAAVAAARNADPGAGELTDRAGEAVGTAAATAAGVETTLWPWVAVLGALLCGAAGLLVTLRAGRWPGMSARYSRPDAAAPPTASASAEQTALDQWRALDRGEDPTL
ncbi:MAG: Trp biosynthesis-associated membrane protein [Sporichthyaceae bacterium]